MVYEVKTHNQAQIEGLLMRNKLGHILDCEVDNWQNYGFEVSKHKYECGIEVEYKFKDIVTLNINGFTFELYSPTIVLGGFWIHIHTSDYNFDTRLCFEDIKSFEIN